MYYPYLKVNYLLIFILTLTNLFYSFLKLFHYILYFLFVSYFILLANSPFRPILNFVSLCIIFCSILLATLYFFCYFVNYILQYPTFCKYFLTPNLYFQPLKSLRICQTTQLALWDTVSWNQFHRVTGLKYEKKLNRLKRFARDFKKYHVTVFTIEHCSILAMCFLTLFPISR